METYETIPNLIANLKPYRHGSSMAIWEYDPELAQRVYSVYSYETRIALVYRHRTGEQIAKLDRSKYSVTTSRLQNIIRKAWELN